MKNFLYILFSCLSFVFFAEGNVPYNSRQDVFTQQTFGDYGDSFLDPVFTDDASRNNDEDVSTFESGVEKRRKEKKVEKSSRPTILSVKGRRNTPTVALPDCTQHTLLKIRNDGTLTFNEDVINPDVFQILTQLVQYMYQSTKRSAPDQLMYPGNFGYGACSTLKSLLEQRGLHMVPFFGTHGGQEGSEIGLISYRKKGHRLQIFIILEGSQGEPFEPLGGTFGPSWMTNLKAEKAKVKPDQLNIPAKYNATPYTFHSGFFNKIFQSKRFFERSIMKCLKRCSVDPFDQAWTKNKSIHTPQELKHFIDTQRKVTIDVYIAGHSQGGGLAQVAAPYITTFLGQHLYGPLFDNKIFNLTHTICFSPARAIGDVYTMQMVEDILGALNIIGYCSPLDMVPCLPLGHNIGQDKFKELATNIFLKLGKLISRLLPKAYRDACEAICSSDNHYETLRYWAYEDPIEILERFCSISLKEVERYKKLLSNPDVLPLKAATEAKPKNFYLEKAEEDLKSIQETQKNLPDVKKWILGMQDHYFKAHTTNFLMSNYHAFKALNRLKKLFKVCPAGFLIAMQHFGPFYCYNFENKGSKWVSLETAFNTLILPCESMDDLNKKINNAVQYQQEKDRIISGK